MNPQNEQIEQYKRHIASETARYAAAGNDYTKTSSYANYLKNIKQIEQTMANDATERARYDAQMAEHARANSPEASALLRSNPTAYMQQYGSAQDVKNQLAGLNPALGTQPNDVNTLRANEQGLGQTNNPLGGATGFTPTQPTSVMANRDGIAPTVNPQTGGASGYAQNVSQGTSDTEKPDKYAPFAITSNLKYGSRGQEVEDLQKYLASIQLYDGKVDGIFGNKTLQAVKQFQSSQGLTADGVVGSKTVAGINAVQGGQPIPDTSKSGFVDERGSNGLLTNPTDAKFDRNTGEPITETDPETKALEDAMASDPVVKMLYEQQKLILEEMQKQNQVVNPDLTISPALVKQFSDEIVGKLDPYYQELLRQKKQDFDITFQRLQQDYDKNIEREQPAFEQSLENQDITEANQGTAFSSGRADRERTLITGQQNRLDDYFQNAQRTIQNNAMSGERTLGSRDFSSLGIPSLQSFAAGRTISPKGSITPSGNRQLFNPIGGIEGSLPIEQRTAYAKELENSKEQERKRRVLAAGGVVGNTVYG